jgi:hypothetical protein
MGAVGACGWDATCLVHLQLHWHPHMFAVPSGQLLKYYRAGQRGTLWQQVCCLYLQCGHVVRIRARDGR